MHFNHSQDAFDKINVIHINASEGPLETTSPRTYSVYCEYVGAGNITCTSIKNRDIYVAKENAMRLASRYCNNDTCGCVYFKHVINVITSDDIAEPCSGISNKTHKINSTQRPLTPETSNNFHVGFITGLSISTVLVVVIITTSVVVRWKKKQFLRRRQTHKKQNITPSNTTRVDNTTMPNLSSTESSSPSVGSRGFYYCLSRSTSTYTTGSDIVGTVDNQNSPPASNVYMNRTPHHYSEVDIAGARCSEEASYSKLHEDVSIRQNTYNTLCEFTEIIK